MAKSKLEKAQEDLVKANITYDHALKRKKMLEKKVKEEEQRELQTVLDSIGMTHSGILELITRHRREDALND